MKLVVIESPFAGNIPLNVAYARAAIADSVHRNEAPIASHLLYTQPGILDDQDPSDRKLGIEAGLKWHDRADLVVFYTDLGWSAGMLASLARCKIMRSAIEKRSLGEGWSAVGQSVKDGVWDGTFPPGLTVNAGAFPDHGPQVPPVADPPQIDPHGNDPLQIATDLALPGEILLDVGPAKKVRGVA